MTPWKKGFMAGLRGRPREAPYEKGMAYSAWVNGWDAGKEEREWKGEAPPIKHIKPEG